MSHPNLDTADKSPEARRLCEQGRWLDVVGLALDWQLDDPGDARAFFYQGIALAELGRLSEAETSYRRALQLDPNNFKIWNNLATLLFEMMEQPDEAVQCLLHALSLNPDNRLGWSNLASMNGQIGRHEKALEYAEKALALDSQMVEAHLHRARAAQMLGRSDVVQSASEALALLPPERFQRVR